MVRVLASFAICALSIAGAIRAEEAKNTYIGVIEKSDRDKSTGTHIRFERARTQFPIITWPSGHATSPSRVYEDDEVLVLLFVGVLGSTETFYLNKTTKRFTAVEVGTLEAIVTKSDFRPTVSIGHLE